ncbi:pentapeptide repeat-containing protein [Streptomyces globosus]|uniref:pentapeptide repeat-containing protein n=1 Tax=Streptomyces globosus TaxID=68209 RepID=UPI00381E44D1
MSRVPQMVLVAVLLLVGGVLAGRAWAMAVKEPESEPRIEVLAGVGAGLITGIAVGLSAIFLEQAITAGQEYATWRASVEGAASIPGFTVAGHDIQGINFSGKSLRNADFAGVPLQGFRFRDTDLTGADFRGADLRGANLIGANLQDADLTGAKLNGALLHSANFAHASLPGRASFEGALLNARTCWPKSLERDDLRDRLRDTKVQEYEDEESGKTLTRYEDVQEDELRGGQQVPDCTLWKNGLRVRPEG